ncbi:VCBS repeat-containing protein [Pelagicoccus sp. SDUM812003]|uniref:FG-GAP repeat domain-containing protein n=1 Tax=Pelagicoccus sp. SDUM812003 TaxID=3041267 RepID=UPI00280D5B65|nr:VCBS repeat-containing protein [Pelagicoccus sp. SDUM812003]MDQ8201824.1 VCBS repeat-containing protein [Pelagicoccus sp. SDUM812003]
MVPLLHLPPVRPLATVIPCLLILLQGCSPPSENEPLALPPVAAHAKAVDDLDLLSQQRIGAPIKGRPWIAHVTPVDLDQDDRMDAVFCEAQENRIYWLRQVSDGTFQELVLAEKMQAPVHVEAVDIDGDDDLDLLVSNMGQVFPNNDRIGSIVILENDGKQSFTPHWVLRNVARVNDVRAADLNRDGELDLAVGQFGYDQGEIRWMERTGPWEFKSHNLLDLSGTINVSVADFNGDSFPDIVALVSQEWEQVWYFENDGMGNFSKKAIWSSTNEDFSSSGMTVGDLNRDGLPDVLFSNGDGFGPVGIPGPRPWHGVQWLENKGNGYFRFHRIGDLGGAYSPIEADLDGDGNMDVVAVAAFNDWSKSDSQSLVWFRNDGRLNFTPHVLAYSPIQLLTIAAGDFDGTGRTSLITGGFHAYPPFNDRMSRILLWKQEEQQR